MANDDRTVGLTDDGWLTSAQAAELLGVTRIYIDYLTKTYRGRPPLLTKYKLGHMRLLRREEVERYKATHPRLGKTVARRRREAALTARVAS